MLVLIAAVLALAEPDTQPPPQSPPAPSPAETAAPSPPPKSHGMSKQTCQTKALSPAEKTSCCKSYPELCAGPG